MLSSHCRAVDPDSAGRFAPLGMLAELSSRPERTVHAWLSWPRGTGAVEGPRRCVDQVPLGLVALVAAGPVQYPRFSIAWLLVHPEARRQGVATALVAHALDHAWSLDATRVFAETLATWPAAAGFWRSVGFEQES